MKPNTLGYDLSLTLLGLVLTTTSLPAAEVPPAAARPLDARMIRYADVSASQIVFVYAGDLWVAGKGGGLAARLTSSKGEEMFPKFSPDGSLVAFSGNYDGNTDIYVIPAVGGVPKRLTYHGALDRVVGWYPDGKSVLMASMMTSEKDRFNKLFRVALAGGLPEPLPVPYGEFGAISPDGQILAYTPISVDFRTWKRYRGGMNPDIWFFDLAKRTARNVTQNPANDSIPMWHGAVLYFLSDRDASKRDNLWSYDPRTGQFRQVTFFKDFDVHFPSMGPSEAVFECAGQLYLLDLATDKYRPVEITVVTDLSTLKPRRENVSGYLHSGDVSPSGKRAVFEARGDLFTVPFEYGLVRNLTRSSGVAERYPAWSPDGKSIAYFSDRTGEYELTLRAEDGSGEETVLTKLGAGYRYRPCWSPDAKKIVFVDQAMKVNLHDLNTKKTSVIDQMLWIYHGELSQFHFSWSADSRWLAYAGDLATRHTALVLYDTKEGKRHQVTSGFYDDDLPTFDPAGKYLFFRSSRHFSPRYSDLDNTWIYPNTRLLLAVPLRAEVASPLAPRNDEENDKDKEKKDADKPADDKKKDEPKESAAKEGVKPAKTAETKPAEKKEDKTADKKDEKKDSPPKPVEIDLADFERRAVVLPPRADNYSDLAAVAGKLLYRRSLRTGGAEDKTPVLFFDLEKREEKTLLDDADDYVLAAKGEKLLARKGTSFSIVEVKEGQSLAKKLNTGGFEMLLDPAAEWRQIYADVWRIERDYFYDPKLHGVNWAHLRQRYGKLLEQCVTRWDVNYVLGELIAELNVSHAYRGGGDMEAAPSQSVGYLGCDFALENGAYRFKKILEASAWDSEARSPLKRPGLKVKEGDYLLAVNGVPMDTSLDPWAALQGLADKTVQLTVNEKPVREGSREVLVQTLGSEARLRHLCWIEANRRRVEEASGGQIGYIYVPDTGVNGQNELVRQYAGQFTKPGLIVDERFNSGGQIPDRFVELLGRKIENYWGVRDGRDWPWPPTAHHGSMVMLMNGWSGSGGDCFPYYFKKAGLGPLIGQRTWGGLIGMTGVPNLIDNGNVTAPTFGIYNTQGEWIIENHGVDPDIEVVDDPAEFAKGRDPQLERAIQELLKTLKAKPPVSPKKPEYPNRAG